MAKNDKKRRDKKGRILDTNEIQKKDGSYEYRYIDMSGEKRSIYSWRLVASDKTPPGKKDKPALRDMEKEIKKALFKGVDPYGGNLTVVELCERYLSTLVGLRETTKSCHRTALNLLKKESFGYKKIRDVHVSDAKLFLIKLQKVNGKKYHSIHILRGVLRPAFQMAYEDDLIIKNPFDWPLANVLIDDSHTRDAISREMERKFLKFVKEDEHFSQYYDGMFFLFKTGVRISELCALTISDINFKKREIKITKQLQYKRGGILYIQDPKTKSGIRTLPMSEEIYQCLKHAVSSRIKPAIEPVVDGYTGFIWLNYRAKKGLRPTLGYEWDKWFNNAVEKHNSIYKLELPHITPHICRHTYCSNMAKSGMYPKVLQYLMGHADIGVTMNTYTHLGIEVAREELMRLGSV